MLYQIYTLPNGLRLIHKKTSSSVAHCSVMINAGSRDEESNENGLAHFIEHILFKETKKRKSFHINNRLESVGGEVNAFTTKEETCIYASFLNLYYERTLELFSDILFNSVFPEPEIEKEKKVVLEEINSYKDTPAEQIFDDFENMIFRHHPIGRFILGTPSSVRKIKKKDIIRFTGKHYHPENMIISSCGDIEFSKLVKTVTRYFSGGPSAGSSPVRSCFKDYSPENKIIKKKTWQAHSIIGNVAYSLKDNKRYSLSLLNNILGGPGMNSRLNMVLREKHGLTYNVESGYLPYSDTGAFHIYFGVEPASIGKTTGIILSELKKLREQKLGPVQLKIAKQQLCGQLAIHFEYNLNEAFAMARALAVNNDIISLAQMTEIIHGLTSADLTETANEIFSPDKLSMLTYTPNK